MNKLVFSFLLLLIQGMVVYGQITSADKTESSIQVKIEPYKNVKIYMGSYFGKNRVLVDSAVLNQDATGFFKKKDKYTPGVYFLLDTAKRLLLEFVMDNDQTFKVLADTLKLDDVTFDGSLDNVLFKSYQNLSATTWTDILKARDKFTETKNNLDSINYVDKQTKGTSLINDYREEIIGKYPNSTLSFLFSLMKRPSFVYPKSLKTRKDSIAFYYSEKDKYWSDTYFSDDRLLRTPFFEEKLDDYFKYYVNPNPDSTYSEINYMLVSARGGKEIFPYLLVKFTNKYLKPEYMGQDKVFVQIFNDFYAKGDSVFLSAESRKTVFDRAYSLMMNQIGQKAADMNLTDTIGKKTTLFSLKSKLTFLVFWDPECSHCRVEIPRVDSFYQAKWKKLGVEIFAVNVNNDKHAEWKTFIRENKLQNWKHGYQTKEAERLDRINHVANYRQLYDIQSTPCYYLLDEQKNILAKQLSLNIYDEIIEYSNKNVKNK